MNYRRVLNKEDHGRLSPDMVCCILTGLTYEADGWTLVMHEDSPVSSKRKEAENEVCNSDR